jgi:hypothetical protein
MSTEKFEAAKRFIREFGDDVMATYAFDEERVAGIKGQGLAADMLTGEVFLFVTLKGDPDERPLQLVELPFYSPAWTTEDAVAALDEHLGLGEAEAVARLSRAGLCPQQG